MRRRREWGTMAVVVGNLSHDVSTDVVGSCDMCFARWISQQTCTLQPRWPVSEPSSWQPPRQIGCFFASANLRHHGGMMRGGCVGAEGGIGGGGGKVFCSMWCPASIDHWPTLSYGQHEALLPAWRHTTISRHARQQVSIAKLEKVWIVELGVRQLGWSCRRCRASVATTTAQIHQICLPS